MVVSVVKVVLAAMAMLQDALSSSLSSEFEHLSVSHSILSQSTNDREPPTTIVRLHLQRE